MNDEWRPMEVAPARHTQQRLVNLNFDVFVFVDEDDMLLKRTPPTGACALFLLTKNALKKTGVCGLIC